MSLDVYLKLPNSKYGEWKQKKAISLAEAGEMKGLIPLIEEYYEDRKPDEYNIVYDVNITHNLGRMAKEAGIYQHLWRPEELNISVAKDLIKPLEEGLFKLKGAPGHYKKFNAENGWGIYEHFVPFVENYLAACKEFPEAVIGISR